MDFLELCKERYSVRKFSPDAVEKEKIELILEAGRLAPTACNLQPQRFFVLTGEENLNKIDKAAGCHFAPPCVIVIGYDADSAWIRQGDSKNYGEVDAALAVSQMMLEAASLGLGTTYIGMFDASKILEEFPDMKGITPICVLPLGYPAEEAHPSRHHLNRMPLEEMAKYL